MDVDDLTDARMTDPPAPRPRRSGLLSMLLVVLPPIIVFCTLAGLAWHAGQPLTNGDTYFHLRFGEEFLRGHWSLTEPGSPTTFGTADWVPTQWLPQVVMAQAESWWGLPGVAWLQGLLHIGLAVTLWLVARPRAGAMASALLLAVALYAASPGLSMRPQVLSYALIAVTTSAWLSSRVDGRARWWLVPLTWVWAMCHGMWPVGIVIGLVAVVGIALDRSASWRGLLKLAAVPIASAVAAALTPVGPALYPAVLLVGSRGQYFAEWRPPDFSRPTSLTLAAFAALVLMWMLRRAKPASWTDILLVGLACAWAVYTTRTLGVAAMMLVPIAARILSDRRPASAPPSRPPRWEVATVLVGGLALLAALAVAVPRTADRAPDDPSWAATLDDLPAGTPVLNDWGRGGLIMWRWPQLDLVMSGYGDVFTDAELARNGRLDGTSSGWVSDAQATGAKYALVVPGSQLAYGLEQQHWTTLHRSADLELLHAPPDWPTPTAD